MSRGRIALLRDRDLVELLLGEPELLALADALVATRAAAVERVRGRKRKRMRLASAAAALAAALAAIALLLVSPWEGSPSLSERALAAVGTQPVLHVVVTQRGAVAGSLVDLASGEPIARTVETEVWFDASREVKKVVSRLDGRTLDEELETRAGSWTTGGPVYTCAWIAAHPVEATKAGVSCNASGDNGTTARTIPEPPPTLDPALAGFVDHYRSALASGEASSSGSGEVDGREVVWLRFQADGAFERVAVDAGTYEPVVLATQAGARLRVETAETVSYDPSVFAKPQQVARQSGGSVLSETEITPQQAAALLGGGALWLGPRWNGLSLVGTTHQQRSLAFGGAAERQRTDVVRFRYAPVAEDGTADLHRRIDIYEGSRCVVSVGWSCTPRDPSDPRNVLLGGFIALLHGHGLYVSVWGEPGELLEAVRALVPVAASE